MKPSLIWLLGICLILIGCASAPRYSGTWEGVCERVALTNPARTKTVEAVGMKLSMPASAVYPSEPGDIFVLVDENDRPYPAIYAGKRITVEGTTTKLLIRDVSGEILGPVNDKPFSPTPNMLKVKKGTLKVLSSPS